MSDNVIEEIVKNLSDLITKQRSRPSKNQYISIGKEAKNNHGLIWTDASITNKVITPVDPNRSFKAKIRNWIKRKLAITAKQSITPALKTQEKFNHEVIDNFNRIIEKIEKNTANSKLLAESLQIINKHLQETINNKELVKRIETIEEAHRTHEKNLTENIDRIETLEHSQRGLAKQIKEVENPTLDFDYLTFEDKYRGPQAEIRKKQMQYVPYFEKCKKVIDIGCGRGEFLELLKEHNCEGIGIDLNKKMVEECERKNITAYYEDAIEFLKKQDDNSLGGIINMQVIEHLKPKYVMELIRTGYKKLKPGSYFIAETVNPMCLDIYRSSFVLDITHERPYHPETIHFLMMEAGFSEIEIKFCSPIPESNILHYPDEKNDISKRNVDLLNAYICNHHEYAAIAKK